MSPALSRSSVLQHVKLGDVLKICDGRFLFRTATNECTCNYCCSHQWCHYSFVLGCDSLTDPLNGQIDYPESLVANYTCNDGYELNGGSTRVCQINGTWSGSAPTCLRKSTQVCSGTTVIKFVFSVHTTILA